MAGIGPWDGTRNNVEQVAGSPSRYQSSLRASPSDSGTVHRIVPAFQPFQPPHTWNVERSSVGCPTVPAPRALRQWDSNLPIFWAPLLRCTIHGLGAHAMCRKHANRAFRGSHSSHQPIEFISLTQTLQVAHNLKCA